MQSILLFPVPSDSRCIVDCESHSCPSSRCWNIACPCPACANPSFAIIGVHIGRAGDECGNFRPRYPPACIRWYRAIVVGNHNQRSEIIAPLPGYSNWTVHSEREGSIARCIHCSEVETGIAGEIGMPACAVYGCAGIGSVRNSGKRAGRNCTFGIPMVASVGNGRIVIADYSNSVFGSPVPSDCA